MCNLKSGSFDDGGGGSGYDHTVGDIIFLYPKQISDEWSNKEFDLVAYKGFTDRLTYILGGVEDLFASLEDSLTVLNIINSSKFVEPIKVTHLCTQSLTNYHYTVIITDVLF